LANIKSQIKRNKQNEKRRLRNRVFRGAARTSVKKARGALEAGNAENARAETLAAISTLDKAAQRGSIHKKNAARRKGRLMKQFTAMKPVEVTVEEPKAKAPVEAKTKKKTPARKKTTVTKKA